MIFFDRRTLFLFDWWALIIVVLLCCCGLMNVFSATYREDVPCSVFFYKQVFGVLSGLIIYFVFCCIHYKTLQKWGYYCYFLVIGLLLFTMIKGSIGMGAQRWLDIGFIKFQPSELTKLFFPAFFIQLIERRFFELPRGSVYVMPVIALLFTIVLVLKQPDLGTAILIALLGSLLLWFSGVPTKYFVYFFGVLLICAPLAYHVLKPYQLQRIEVFLGEGDAQRERYQIEQSQIAVGSGGLFGKGFLQGTQHRFQFLPESRTDFIFSVFCEEWGFVGALLLIFLYMLLFWRLCIVISSVPMYMVRLLAIGLGLSFIISTMVNMGMVIDLLPIVGIPLPFMTYGITHVWITMASLGWINGIAARRYLMHNSSSGCVAMGNFLSRSER
jgi:rod shape determining protein RodA